MANLKRSESELKKETEGMGIEYKPNEYPYGLCLDLNDETLEKIGLNAKVGDVVHFMARAEVKSTSEREDDDGTDKNLSLQITDISDVTVGENKPIETRMYGE